LTEPNAEAEVLSTTVGTATPTEPKAPQFPPSATSDMALKTEANAPDDGVDDDDRPIAGDPPLTSWQDDLDRPQRRRPREADRRPDVVPYPDGSTGGSVPKPGSSSGDRSLIRRPSRSGEKAPVLPPSRRDQPASREAFLCKPDLHNYGILFSPQAASSDPLLYYDRTCQILIFEHPCISRMIGLATCARRR
jgi:hypothetical protein